MPIYAAGRPHALKEPCGLILMEIAQRPRFFVTDAEILQELLHRYLALRLWPEGAEVLRRFAVLLRGRTESIHGVDVEHAASTARQVSDLSARDLLHLAVMTRIGTRRIVSADRDFDRVPHLERLDPAEFSDWRSSLI